MSIELIAKTSKVNTKVGKFIDFDKNKRRFYNNLYLDDIKIVIKMPLLNEKGSREGGDVKIEKFDLAKYTYLLAYD